MQKILKIAVFISLLAFFPSVSDAAIINLTTSKDVISAGDEFHAIISINSEDVGINATQAKLKYSNDLLEVRKVDKTGSVFSFWLVEPSYDNTKGEVSLIGGAASGFSGKSLQVIDITFRAKGSGTANLSFTDSAVTASDGSGTNVLSASKGLEIKILTKSELTSIGPALLLREAELAAKAPAKPVVKIPLYPNPEGWYDLSSDFSATWELPIDVSNVATKLDQNPDSTPDKAEGLFNNKTFKALSNGIWYLHVQFKNNIGWGVTNHYRIAIDTVPPLPFKVTLAEGAGDNPTPTLNFETKDQFSGIDSYIIKIDGGTQTKTDQGTYTFDPLPPGEHNIVIDAQDKAGNATESKITFNIEPIASPDIISVRKDVFAGEGGLSINGSVSGMTTILIDLKDSNGNIVYQTKTMSDEEGLWASAIDAPLKKGSYYIEARNRDSRGATSFPVKSDPIKVSERPVLTISGIGITYPFFLAGLIVLGSALFFGGWFLRRAAGIQRDRRVLIAQRDVNAALTNIKNDIESILGEHKLGVKLPESVETKVNFMLRKINDNITKNKNYILENIDEIE